VKRRRQVGADVALLDLWRPPEGAGAPVGCLATTYTFDAELFDRYCLAAFLAIDSDPDREDLAYLLERESQLANCYVGVLVDRAHAGVTHSLRWDVLPVRVPGGIQHAKLSILAWANHVRVIIASANLSEPGYRYNREVVGVVDFTPVSCDQALLKEQLDFLTEVLRYVPGRIEASPPIGRAHGFIQTLARQTSGWAAPPTREPVRRVFVPTVPARPRSPGNGMLSEVFAVLGRGRPPVTEIRLASPFFDKSDPAVTVAALCAGMGRRSSPVLRLAVPALQVEDGSTPARLQVPDAYRTGTQSMGVAVQVDMLPETDQDRNARPWHAKVYQFHTSKQIGFVVGSSNCTAAGLGVKGRANLEANLLYVVDKRDRKTARDLPAVWELVTPVERLEEAEWLGTAEDSAEEPDGVLLPAGFVEALFEGGPNPKLHLTFDPAKLPETWQVLAGTGSLKVLTASEDSSSEQTEYFTLTLAWGEPNPPAQVRVRWGDAAEADWPLNVSDPATIPPPPELQGMSAEDMLRILAASDPGAVLRRWASGKSDHDLFEMDLDSASATDLDPLRRYDLGQTFLHQVRRRARLFAQYRQQLGRPVWTMQALNSRLTGLLGAQTLVERFEQECRAIGADQSEAVLILGDLLMALAEVQYESLDGAVTRHDFEGLYRSFLKSLASGLDLRLKAVLQASAPDISEFWRSVVERCGGTS